MTALEVVHNTVWWVFMLGLIGWVLTMVYTFGPWIMVMTAPFQSSASYYERLGKAEGHIGRLKFWVGAYTLLLIITASTLIPGCL